MTLDVNIDRRAYDRARKDVRSELAPMPEREAAKQERRILRMLRNGTDIALVDVPIPRVVAVAKANGIPISEDRLFWQRERQDRRGRQRRFGRKA